MSGLDGSRHIIWEIEEVIRRAVGVRLIVNGNRLLKVISIGTGKERVEEGVNLLERIFAVLEGSKQLHSAVKSRDVKVDVTLVRAIQRISKGDNVRCGNT